MKKSNESKPKSPLARTGIILLYALVVFAALGGIGALLSKDAAKDDDFLTSTELKEYVSTEHDFKATFPGFPTAEREPIDVQGYDLTQTYYGKELSRDEYYAVAVVDYPSDFDMSDTKSRLEGALNGSAQSISGEITSSSFSKVGGYDAIDGTVKGRYAGQQVVLRSRNILVGQRLYTIMVVGSTESEYNAFRDSFELR